MRRDILTAKALESVLPDTTRFPTSTFTPALARSTSADRPAAPDTAPLPFYFLLLPSSEETKSDSLCPGGCAPRDMSRQRNTHNIELREVRYPWHPWHARTVAVHEAPIRNGRAVCRCGIDENWMSFPGDPVQSDDIGATYEIDSLFVSLHLSRTNCLGLVFECPRAATIRKCERFRPGD